MEYIYTFLQNKMVSNMALRFFFFLVEYTLYRKLGTAAGSYLSHL